MSKNLFVVYSALILMRVRERSPADDTGKSAVSPNIPLPLSAPFTSTRVI